MINNNEVFVVAGGPSLTGFPFDRLRARDTIAVNVSALDVPDPTLLSTEIRPTCSMQNVIVKKFGARLNFFTLRHP